MQSYNIVLNRSLGCFFILFCVEQNIISLFRSEWTILDFDHAENVLPIIIFTTFFSRVRIIMFDNDFWYVISYFLNWIYFLNGDAIFFLYVIMSMRLPILAVITLARISTNNAMLVTLAILLLTLRLFACTAFKMHSFGSGTLDF